jgi:hypothetical protein
MHIYSEIISSLKQSILKRSSINIKEEVRDAYSRGNLNMQAGLQAGRYLLHYIYCCMICVADV